MLRYGVDDLRLFFDGDLRFSSSSVKHDAIFRSWLRALVNPDKTSEQLAHCSPCPAGSGKMRSGAPAFSGSWWRSARRRRHPNADRLSVCEVNVGAAAPLRIVCGAPCGGGMKVPCARIGATLGGVPRQAVSDQSGDHARRREPGDAVFGARAGPVRDHSGLSR